MEGRVIKRANNMVKVHLDIDDDHDDQGNWWFPYSPEGNNIFHCMPDEGARIKVYFPNGIEKKAIAVNSTRGGSEEMKSRTVFQKPTTKVFHMPGAAKMELGEDGVLFEKGTVRIHLDQNDIKVQADTSLLVMAINNLGLGSKEAVVELIRMKALSSITLLSDKENRIVIEHDKVGIQSGNVQFKKVELPFVDLLTDEELMELYIDQELINRLPQEYEDKRNNNEIAFEEFEAYKFYGIKSKNVDEKAFREKIAAEASHDPGAKEKARSMMGALDETELRTNYQNKYVFVTAKDNKSDKEKEEEIRIYKNNYNMQYEQYNTRRMLQYETEQRKIREARGLKTESTFFKDKINDVKEHLTPKNPIVNAVLAEAKKEYDTQFSKMTEIMKGIIAQFTPQDPEERARLQEERDNYALEHVIPLKPDYLSKTIDISKYYSRYTYVEIGLADQIYWAEFNKAMGIIALIMAIPTGGTSILLAALDISIGVASIYVNSQKLDDLQAGNSHTDPKLFGLNQDALNLIGAGVGVAYLSSLARSIVSSGSHADQRAFSRTNAALDD
ncbi:hypothetical protein [Cohnella terricola]|uniref:Uncharacterized protein n=1 Tax=Cohnella terricola TaxID=1289167 RepID=A0A559J5E2_9BACL|nr:hypothetical protein [Cohnella terricola]TVX95105.1 hypothetical protein FPZ45_24190 [Cohnella terricola]